MYVTRSEFHSSLLHVWNALEQLYQKEGHDVADLTTAFADLDTLLSDVETEVANLKQQVATGNTAATQQAADTLEAKIAAARTALATASSTGGTTTTATPTGDPGTPVGTDPTQPA
jgi:paraquat-inducible protein B